MLQAAENAVEELVSTAEDALVVQSVEPGRAIALSLIVPTLNEVENIASLLRSVHSQLWAVLGDAFEILVVDDDSPDGTWQAAEAAMQRLPGLRVLRRTCERGLATAVIRGWQLARGEWLGTLNADFQHPPEILPRMLALTAEADLVVASRYCANGSVGNWNLYRRVASRMAYTLGALLVPPVFRRVTDPLSGYYLVRRAAIAGVDFHPAGYKTLIEVLATGGVTRIAETGYRFGIRRAGRSKAVPEQYWLYLRHLGRLRRALDGN